MTTAVNISKTPMAPYMGILNSMDNNEKMAVALFLVSSLPNVEIVQSKLLWERGRPRPHSWRARTPALPNEARITGLLYGRDACHAQNMHEEY